MPRFAANLTMLFNEVEFLDRFALAAKAGFMGVEYHFPYQYDKAKLSEPLNRHNLVQVLFDLPAGDWAGGERGIGCLPDRRREFQDGVDQAIEYASALGCRQLNCLAGIAPAGESEEILRATFTANLRFAAEALDKAGIKLLIEPINTRDVPGFYLRHTNQALEIIREVGSSNLYLQYDMYHMRIMEGGLASTIEANLPRIAHMQVAQNPGRHEPGTGSGDIDYGFLFGFIDRIGYAGWIGAEYTPAATTEAGLSWFRPYRS